MLREVKEHVPSRADPHRPLGTTSGGGHALDECDHQHSSTRPGHPAGCKRVNTRMAKAAEAQEAGPTHSGPRLRRQKLDTLKHSTKLRPSVIAVRRCSNRQALIVNPGSRSTAYSMYICYLAN
ncbi:unnamed protein product [Linum trigynum]|uniref:Uncharacterized protein n=1 Tax=Linum trigynum TaxID=586398 RepID=A0AAV2EBF3_9ROSI